MSTTEGWSRTIAAPPPRDDALQRRRIVGQRASAQPEQWKRTEHLLCMRAGRAGHADKERSRVWPSREHRVRAQATAGTRQQAGRQAQPYSDQRAYCWPHMPAPRSAPSVRRFGAAQGWRLVTPRAAAARWAWRCKARNESKMASKMKSPKSQNGQVFS